MGLFGGHGGNQFDTCDLILILVLLNTCGCGINFDCTTLIIVMLLLLGGCGNGCMHGGRPEGCR